MSRVPQDSVSAAPLAGLGEARPLVSVIMAMRDSAARRTGRRLTLPARHLMVVRVLSGWMNILAQIDCTVAVRDLARRWLPGF